MVLEASVGGCENPKKGPHPSLGGSEMIPEPSYLLFPTSQLHVQLAQRKVFVF